MDKTVIADSDSLIALLNVDDANHTKAVGQLEKLIGQGYRIIYPATVIVETTTTFQIKFSNPRLSDQIVKMTAQAQLPVETVDQRIIDKAIVLFSTSGSKKNTLFDAVVAATAQIMNAEAIFSFDKWYETKGFKLVSDI